MNCLCTDKNATLSQCIGYIYQTDSFQPGLNDRCSLKELLEKKKLKKIINKGKMHFYGNSQLQTLG